ncbi:MAG: phospho-N-acetylmuramoyl-pentapeptide-transferase [Chloroflexi bacterium]|nr:phospho-N-acetylmuramoyl-pentapeptide-transferase [Chloroflexota bacterium]MCC6896681.1 phospho-N-acetylmuramoyl-pentapeptide-transferase [Anaerolineae bacterium]
MAGQLPFAITVGGVSFLLAVIWGGPFVEILRRLKIGKLIQPVLGEAHQKKMGTPTMGGILIVVPVVLISLGLNLVNVIRTVTGASILLPLVVMVGFGVLGMVDDWEGIQRSQGRPLGEGISPRAKLAGQIILAAGVALMISFYDGGFQFANQVIIPLLPFPIAIPPLLFVPITMFYIIGMSNAINFTDGMDGLAGIISASAFAAYGVIAYLQGQIFLTQFCFLLVGACFAFLWFNAHPAQLFMGDAGSLALGATLGTIAIMTGQWLLLPVIAIVPVVETISVILQVGYYKRTKDPVTGLGKRLFRIAPIHFHFQKGGWSETQVVQRFWLIGLLAAIFGVALALL